MMRKNTTHWICVNAMGIALFVVLALCVQMPVFENYYLCLGYAVLVVWAGFFGSVSGALTGSLGVVLYCLVTGGLRGMPGWAAGNLLIGLVLGRAMRRLDAPDVPLRDYILWMLEVMVVTAVAMLGVKSLTECLLYGQPFALRAAKNVYAFVADTAVMWASLPAWALLRGQKAQILPDGV